MNKAIAIIITAVTFGAAVYLLSHGSNSSQTAVVSGDSQTTGQTNAPTTGKGNQYRYGQQNTVKPNPSTYTQTS